IFFGFLGFFWVFLSFFGYFGGFLRFFGVFNPEFRCPDPDFGPPRSDCERPGPELCSFPSANVSLLGEHREKVLLYGQLYRISLELELPESPVNRELGMFMVRLTCYGSGGKTLATASRSAMLHYRSRLLRALHTAAFAGLFLSGFAEQSQTLELELLGRYREDPVGLGGDFGSPRVRNCCQSTQVLPGIGQIPNFFPQEPVAEEGAGRGAWQRIFDAFFSLSKGSSHQPTPTAPVEFSLLKGEKIGVKLPLTGEKWSGMCQGGRAGRWHQAGSERGNTGGVQNSECARLGVCSALCRAPGSSRDPSARGGSVLDPSLASPGVSSVHPSQPSIPAHPSQPSIPPDSSPSIPAHPSLHIHPLCIPSFSPCPAALCWEKLS
uniref:Seipin n=1 Tax=Cyanistes caeruleus TaxID=156563 RepID=A0A8C0VM30_CYACU